MARLIPVGDRCALIDDEDHELISAYLWHPCEDPTSGVFYARAHVFVDGKRTTISMHRLIMGEPPCLVDHIDKCGLNNQRSNLRLASGSQNKANGTRYKNGQFTYKGVYPQGGKWRAQIRVSGKLIHLGYFTDEAAAARAYDNAALERFGEFANLNFPQELVA